MPDTNTGAADRPSDTELIRRHLESGDGAAFGELVRRHRPLIRRLLYTVFNGQREEMEDAEQEIVLSLFQGLKGFRFRSSFRTYLYSLVRNRAVEGLRRLRSRRRLLTRVRSALWNREPPDPEELALRGVQRDGLLSAFRSLSPADRQLIVMKDVEGFSLEAMAEVLAVPVGTVKSRLHRARARLARVVKGRS